MRATINSFVDGAVEKGDQRVSRGEETDKANLLYKIITCALVFAGVLLPAAVFSADHSYRTKDLPHVGQAVLDLTGYSDYGSPIPLEGEWEFYWNTWLVTDDVKNVEPDLLIDVPQSWEGLEVQGEKLGSGGIASYKMTVTNCPADLGYIIRVPDSQTTYRVFMDGRLVLSGGQLSKNTNEVEVRTEVREKAIGELQAETCEIVIEVAANHTGGLYMAPQLEEVRNAAVNPTLIAYLQSGVVVGLLVYIIAFGVIAAFRGSSFRADYLTIFCLILLITVLTHTELMRLKVVKAVGAHFEYVWLLHAVMLVLLPACLYLCSRHLFGYQASKRKLGILIVATIVMVLMVLLVSLSPRPWYSVVVAAFCVVLCSAVVGFVLVSAWRHSDGGALLFSGATTVLLSSLVVDSLYTAGCFVVNASYLLGVCAILYATLMFALFVRRMVAQERRARELDQVRYQLKEAEVSLMLSQIRPHFLYNTLTAVMALIPSDPQLAQQTLMKFSQYLRVNIDSVAHVCMIPFSQELDHIKTYLDIEKLRFEDRLQIEFCIEETNFQVPQLSIQPFVENAVKHGVCKKPKGGKVTIRAWEQEDMWCVWVSDDGVGFDTAILRDDNEMSAGIRNVMYRLKECCQATVEFESALGCGCVVSVKIPKGDEA